MILPLAWLGLANLGLYKLYGRWVPGGDTGNVSREALVTFTLSHAVPFLGVSRTAYREAVETLFGRQVLPETFQALGVGQSLLNALLIFLLLLALRNHFRVR